MLKGKSGNYLVLDSYRGHSLTCLEAVLSCTSKRPRFYVCLATVILRNLCLTWSLPGPLSVAFVEVSRGQSGAVLSRHGGLSESPEKSLPAV